MKMSAIRWRNRRVFALLASLIALTCAASALVGYRIANAGPVVPGKPIDAATARIISLAALSCPTLTGPRLAGQIMANSGFDRTTANQRGRTGLGGLTTTAFGKWAPWPRAASDDDEAAIYALAHDDCDLIGRVRQAKAHGAKVRGEPWDTGLAAFHLGVDAVVKAGSVPRDAREYVQTVIGYANWYAQQPVFTGKGQPAGAPQPPAPQPGAATAEPHGAVALPDGVPPVPDEILNDVRAAGRVCAQVTPARVAAQVAVSSGFNHNLRGPHGALGVAQFSPELWNEYADQTDSPWDPPTAIRLLGHAMCDLVSQLDGLASDPYPLALAAFRVGQTPVRAAGKVPPVPGVSEFVARVLRDADAYQHDQRLTAAPASPSPSADAPSTTAKAAVTTPARPPATTGNPSKPTDEPTKPPASPSLWTGRIVGLAGKCLDVRFSHTEDGTPIQLWGCDNGAAQNWTIHPDGTIRAFGKCLDVRFSGTADGTPIQLWGCDNGAAQHWTFYPDGTIRAFGKCLDVSFSHTEDGTRIQLWGCDGTNAQKWQRWRRD